MRRRRLALAAVFAAGAAVAYPALRPAKSALALEAEWSPTPAEIVRTLGTGGPGRFDDDRHTAFAQAFKKRYRDQRMGIGARFTGPERARLLCAISIPRWDMARIAAQFHDEAKQVFGTSVTVDICESYLTMPHKKIGESREDAKTGRVRVVFDPSFTPAPPTARGRVAQPARRPSSLAEEMQRVRQRFGPVPEDGRP
jgi:hypothetical protein